MAGILTRPPPMKTKKLPKYGGGGGRLHTLHSTYKDIFTIQTKHKPAILAFRSKEDAITFGKLLETNYEIEKKWPLITMDNDDLWFKYEERELSYLTIMPWDYDNIKTLCITHDFSMIDVKMLAGLTKLSGVYCSWDVNYELWAELLEEKYLS